VKEAYLGPGIGLIPLDPPFMLLLRTAAWLFLAVSRVEIELVVKLSALFLLANCLNYNILFALFRSYSL
jgi:hypothetical protein